MQIKCSLSELLPAVQAVSGIISRRAYRPILSCLEIRANEEIEVRATDMEISLEVAPEGLVLEKGAAVVPAKLLLNVLKTLPQGVVGLEAIDDITHLECQNIHFELNGFKSEDYPQATEFMSGTGLTLDSSMLKKHLPQVLRAISREENRPSLTGLLWQARGNLLTLIGCDSYRLAVAKTPISEETDMDLLIPGSACRLLAHLLGEDELIMMWNNHKVAFSFRDHNLEARLLAEKYPPWQPLIPADFMGKAELNVKDLEQTLKRVSLLSPKGNQMVKFSFRPDRLALWTRSPDQGEAKEELPICWSGECVDIGLNAGFVLDGLAGLSGEKVLLQIDEDRQKVLLGDPEDRSFACLVMVLRLPEGWQE
ncbi:MAG: DNA polymerase III subunit beta [Syntrophomonadaceae bacterium]|nr:DNA polymerase III subunit beta [Bacillota bacterium]